MFLCIHTDVTVLVAPATVVITEEAGSVQVCATLSAVAGVITAIPVYLTVTVNSDCKDIPLYYIAYSILYCQQYLQLLILTMS